MSIFDKKVDEAIAKMKETPEEWIWVEGYKGTDKDMKCRNYQFAMYKQFDIPENEKVEDCKNGFHLCLNLNDVFKYYSIKNGNRFFRVRAFVRKKDFDEYCQGDNPNNLIARVPVTSTTIVYPWSNKTRDKLAARSIAFLYEMTTDEILRACSEIGKEELDGWSDEIKKVAIESNIPAARAIVQTGDLVELGYSMPFAKFIVHEGGYMVAKAVGSQADLSMDMKVLFIMEDLLSKSDMRNSMFPNGMSMDVTNAALNAFSSAMTSATARRR